MTIEETIKSFGIEVGDIKPEEAIHTLKGVLFNRANYRHGNATPLALEIDIALCRAIESLQKEVDINSSAACDHLNDNHIWVSKDVYYKIMDNPDGVIFEAVGKPPIIFGGKK